MQPWLEIRDALDVDAPAIAELTQRAFAPLRRIYRPVRSSDGAAPLVGLSRLVAVTNDRRIVATVLYRPVDDRLHLIGLAVHPDLQRQGTARRLISELAGRARAGGARCLSLYTIVETGNPAIFARLGFRTIRVAPAVDLEPAEAAVGAISEAYMERPVEASGAGSRAGVGT